MSSDLSLFLGQLLKRPKEISALAPSSRMLARAMAAEIPADAAPVAEFGPGTGNISRAILERGIAPADLTLFEMNPLFCERLRVALPGVQVENRPAQEIVQIASGGFGAIVSGLPLLSMPHGVRQDIIAAAFGALRPGGCYIQFTYGPKPPLSDETRAELGLGVARGRRVLWNLPPAQVYVYRRAAET
ncbi:MAG: methyltransferase type 12 [Paracoccaceae bacterium]